MKFESGDLVMIQSMFVAVVMDDHEPEDKFVKVFYGSRMWEAIPGWLNLLGKNKSHKKS